MIFSIQKNKLTRTFNMFSGGGAQAWITCISQPDGLWFLRFFRGESDLAVRVRCNAHVNFQSEWPLEDFMQYSQMLGDQVSFRVHGQNEIP